MLFLFPPKMNNDFVFQDDPNVMEVEAGATVTTYLTWEAMKAAALATGSAVAPVAVGIVGAAAIGWVVDETIGWDVIADYGQGIIDNVLGNGGSVDDIYNADSETVNLTNEFVSGAAHAVDSIPDSKILDYGEWMALPSVTLQGELFSTPYNIGAYSSSSSYRIIIRGNYSAVAYNSPYRVSIRGKLDNSYYYTQDIAIAFIDVPALNNDSGEFEAIGNWNTGRTLDNIRVEGNGSSNGAVSLSNLRYAIIPDRYAIPDDVITQDLTDVKVAFPPTVEDRKELITNNIGGVGAIPLQDNQAVTGVTFPEMVSANTPEDMDESTANDLGVLGILPMIYNLLKSLPVRIVGAFTSLFNMIINAIKAIPDVITSGIDNLLININAVGSNIRAGIDDLLIDINAIGSNIRAGIDDLLIDINGVGANIRAGIDNLLINVSAIPDVIASGIDNLLINMGDWTDSLINTWVSGLGVIIGGINDIWSWLTGLAEWLIALVVPTSLAVLQPSITALTGTFNDKFSFIIAPIKSFGNAYNQSKSLYDVTFRIKYRDIAEDVHVLPIAYKPAVDVFRLVANGLVVVLTYISMYNRFRKEVIAV